MSSTSDLQAKPKNMLEDGLELEPEDGSELELIVHVTESETFDPREGRVRVEVVDMQGASTKLLVLPGHTMLQIKQSLEKIEGTPVWKQIFGVEWAEGPLGNGSTAEAVLSDGCKVYLVKTGIPPMDVLDGLQLWLDCAAESTMTLASNANTKGVLCWESRVRGSNQTIAATSGEQIHTAATRTLMTHLPQGNPELVELEDPKNGVCVRAVEFDFERSMEISPPLEQIQTMLSVHRFKPPSRAGSSTFYIITGTSQGPFHGNEEFITSGHGAWEGAEGEPYYNGHIRLNGGEAQPIKETKIWRDAFRVATVACTSAVPVRGSRDKVDRIGRDRDCHQFAGEWASCVS
jgi:hypothetical protein